MINKDWDFLEGTLVHITFREPAWKENPTGIRSIRGTFDRKIDDFILIQTLSRMMMINIRSIVKIQEERENYKNNKGY